MAKTLLRSGCLDDFQAVGDNGQSVFDSAAQIRETLRLRNQPLVDCLAIEQRNDEGDYVHWYAPVSGKITSWVAASDTQRSHALCILEDALQNAKNLSLQCQQSGKTAVQLFGHLLEKVLHFPGSQHVYLVDNQPIITFWGFISISQTISEHRDPLACLRQLPEPVSASILLSHPDVPLFNTTTDPSPAPLAPDSAPPPVPEISQNQQADLPVPRRSTLWLLPIGATLVATLVALFIWWPQFSSQPGVPTPLAIPAKQPSAFVPAKLNAELPLAVAVFSPPAPTDNLEPDTPAPRDKTDNLVMIASQVRDGITQFLDGSWQIQITSSKSATKTPESIIYRIKRNTGTASIQLAGTVSCNAAIYSGLQQSGTLMIKPRSKARCSDNTYYTLPQISCKSAADNAALCSARYQDDDMEIRVFIKQVKG